MYKKNTAMTAGAVVKYLTEQNDFSSISSLADMLVGLKIAKVKKFRKKYYVFMGLYSVKNHVSTLAIPFDWSQRHTPSVKEGLFCAKAQFKLECMLNKDYENKYK